VPAATLAAARQPIAGRAAAVGVVMASRGYPFGAGEVPGVALPVAFREQNAGGGEGRACVFAASVTGAAEPLTSGTGRVLTVVARGVDFAAARASAYAEVERIGKTWTTARWRRDVALQLPSAPT
jgi:phosphoribosylamine-glycine ligase